MTLCAPSAGTQHFIVHRLALQQWYSLFTSSPAAPVRGRDSVYGSGSGPITLDNVVCTGGESNLLSCQHNPVFDHNCQHYEDVAVICNSKEKDSSFNCSSS